MKTFYKKQSVVLAMFCLVATLVSSCKKDDPEVVVYGDAKLRVVNTVPGSAAQDFYQNDTKVSTTPIAYGSSSSYLTVKGGNSTVHFKNTGTATINASSGVGLNTNEVFTVFYYTDASGSGKITGFPDDNTTPAASKARVRFVNFGLGFNNTVNISYAGTAGASITTGLAYGYVSNYNSVDANTNLAVFVQGATVPTVIPGSNFEAGKIYTVWFDAASATTANYHVVQQN
jgi:hypothetical protein